MKNIRPSVYQIMLIMVINTACTTVKRYKSATYVKGDYNLVYMHLTGAKIEPEAKEPLSKDLWGLSDRGQEALVTALDKRYDDNDKFIKALNNQFMKKDDSPTSIDFTSKNLKMIFTISKKRNYSSLGNDTSKFSPADRIEYIKYNLRLPDSIPLKFQKWNQYSTQYGTVNIADITFSQSLSATAGYGVEATSSNQTKNGSSDNQFVSDTKGLTSKPNIGLTGNMGTTEAQKVQYRYIQLNGNLDDKNIYMEEEGMREIDLTGNVTADVSLKFDEHLEFIYKISLLKAENGDYNKADALKVIAIPVKLPELENTPEKIKGILTLEYIYRHVKPGSSERTYFEYDDHVEYYQGTDKKEVTIFKKSDYLPRLFYIGRISSQALSAPILRTANGSTHVSTKLAIKEGSDYQPLRFASVLEARDFLNWALNYKCETADLHNAIKWGPYELYSLEGTYKIPVTKKYINDTVKSFSVLDYYQ